MYYGFRININFSKNINRESLAILMIGGLLFIVPQLTALAALFTAFSMNHFRSNCNSTVLRI